ncbi:MAG: helix-turn-helix domain-containing protein [Defluviitaleaceae bacterium]|nr:helix-turn-helix domain-containing protein [Defluviitaleaceae bacterium]
MQGAVGERGKNAMKVNALIESNPELKKVAEEFEQEYELRKKMVLARKEAGLTQKELEQRSGLDQRTISRMEVDEKISPSVKTLMRYLGAMGYQLDIVETAQ